MRSIQSRWPWLLVVAVVAVVGWWLLRPHDSPSAVAEGPATAEVQPPPVATPLESTEPAIRHPLDPADAADAAIPALADSDAAAWDAMAGVVGDVSVLDVLLRDHLIQRLVTMIDNLTEPRITTRALAMRALPGDFLTEADATRVDSTRVDANGTDRTPLRIAPANAQRYARYVDAFVQADPERLVAVYRRFYPLFQQAYTELGGPDAYFNDRLVEVLDHLLRAPEPTAPPQVEPDANGRFRYTDPALERLSVGQKALLRLSPEQRSAVKQQLRAIRQALARG